MEASRALVSRSYFCRPGPSLHPVIEQHTRCELYGAREAIGVGSRRLFIDGDLGLARAVGLLTIKREADRRCTLDVEHEHDFSSLREGPLWATRVETRVEAMNVP
jgi:hypothetical protein